MVCLRWVLHFTGPDLNSYASGHVIGLYMLWLSQWRAFEGAFIWGLILNIFFPVLCCQIDPKPCTPRGMQPEKSRTKEGWVRGIWLPTGEATLTILLIFLVSMKPHRLAICCLAIMVCNRLWEGNKLELKHWRACISRYLLQFTWAWCWYVLMSDNLWCNRNDSSIGSRSVPQY